MIVVGIVLVDDRVLSGKSDVRNASKALGRCFESGKAGFSTAWTKILSIFVSRVMFRARQAHIGHNTPEDTGKIQSRILSGMHPLEPEDSALAFQALVVGSDLRFHLESRMFDIHRSMQGVSPPS